jgi:DNA-binding transcriptional LysR family regulator
VTAPNDLGTICVAEMVVAFQERYPLVDVELVLTGRVVNLVEEGVDLAIRAGPGPLPDSSLVARKLPPMESALYASPSYLAAHGTPASVESLAEHACIPFRAKGEVDWVLTGPEGEVRQHVRGRISADDMQCIREVAASGGGIALLPRIFAAPLVAEGKLARILHGHISHAGMLHVLYAPSKVVPAKIAAFRDFVIEGFDRLRAAASADDA